jgi:hypothetical protein
VSAPEGVAALRKVLVAYAAHDPKVGYCQGMNFLAALLLLAVDKDEERCFWCGRSDCCCCGCCCGCGGAGWCVLGLALMKHTH